MNEIKFTSDGKKVVVIGSLNSVEKIVQEIFVVDGSEIPSGEHFVVKSLHDAPSVSWKEKQLKDFELRYEKEKAMYLRDIEDQDKRYRKQCALLSEKMKYIGLALKNADEKSFETLVNYITGKITHIVEFHYSVPKIYELAAWNELYEGRLRLISIFGMDEGKFTYAIGDYYDYSGSNKKFFPFTNYEDAFAIFKELLLKEDVSEERLKLAKQYNISYPHEKVAKYVNERIATLNGYNEKSKIEITNRDSEINSLKDIIPQNPADK